MPSRASKRTSPSHIKVLYFLVAFRICNALLLQTFFQPDEYFQSLEPAWKTAFGESSGAWITWEWNQRLRSSLHPFFFAGVYRVSDLVARALQLNPSLRSEVILAAPKTVQALFAAATDYYTWKLAQKAYGAMSKASYGALILTIISPWQWFCSTRTLSNSVETTLTAVALYAWPFEATLDTAGRMAVPALKQMRVAFAFAALAAVLRPTNTVIWIVIAVYTAMTASKFRVFTMIKALLLESTAAAISGSAILVISVLSDRLYYGEWTFPPLRFIHFNVVQSLAVFYGRNRPDYYVTEGLPLLLTTSLPFVAFGLLQVARGKTNTSTTKSQTTAASPELLVLRPLALCVAAFIALMSLIAHKEVRFIYPLLPALNVLGAAPFAHFFSPLPRPRATAKKTILLVLLVVNISFAFYISQVHQRGVVDVTHFLRREYEQQQQQQRRAGQIAGGREQLPPPTTTNMTVAFLMPCHSTPWRSHLIHGGIAARALTCEPPIDVPMGARAAYLDEADVFYADPTRWMQENMAGIEGVSSAESKRSRVGTDRGIIEGKAQWPEYLVFFEQLEPTMKEFLRDTRYRDCWRGFNTHWHDDSRRKGDVVVWCLSAKA